METHKSLSFLHFYACMRVFCACKGISISNSIVHCAQFTWKKIGVRHFSSKWISLAFNRWRFFLCSPSNQLNAINFDRDRDGTEQKRAAFHWLFSPIAHPNTTQASEWARESKKQSVVINIYGDQNPFNYIIDEWQMPQYNWPLSPHSFCIRLPPKIALIECGCSAAERTSEQASERTNKRASSMHYNSIGIQSITFSHIMLLYLIILSFHLHHTHSHIFAFAENERKKERPLAVEYKHTSFAFSRSSLSIRFFSVVPVDWITVCVNSQCDAAAVVVIILDFSNALFCMPKICLPSCQPNCWMWMPFDGRWHSQCVY